jgi:hypothetical protein
VRASWHDVGAYTIITVLQSKTERSVLDVITKWLEVT